MLGKSNKNHQLILQLGTLRCRYHSMTCQAKSMYQTLGPWFSHGTFLGGDLGLPETDESPFFFGYFGPVLLGDLC